MMAGGHVGLQVVLYVLHYLKTGNLLLLFQQELMSCSWGEGNAHDGGRGSGTSNRTLCSLLSLDGYLLRLSQ